MKDLFPASTDIYCGNQCNCTHTQLLDSHSLKIPFAPPMSARLATKQKPLSKPSSKRELHRCRALPATKESSEPNDPLAYAMKASLAYINKDLNSFNSYKKL